MSDLRALWQQKYPGAFCWSFGDSPEMADELAALVIAGRKRGSCCSLASYQREERPVVPGSYHIVLNSAGEPACVLRTRAMRLIRFDEVDAQLAALEGEGDLSLDYWRQAHQAFFEREGSWSPTMPLIYEEFSLVEVAAAR